MLLRFKEGSGNPTQTLMAVIQKRDLGKFDNKDEDFFLGVDGRAVKILSGDPSKGAISLDMEDPLSAGQVVQVGCQLVPLC